MTQKNIVSSEMAFLGHGSKISTIKFCFDNNVLVCQESRKFLLPPTILSFYFGPCVTLGAYYSLIDLSGVPFFAILLLFSGILLSWLFFIYMLLYRKNITFDFSSNLLIFVKKVIKRRQYVIELSDVIRIVSGSIQRMRSNRTDDLITCYYFSIILNDNQEIRICETTNKEDIDNVINTILLHCDSKGIQWKK